MRQPASEPLSALYFTNSDAHFVSAMRRFLYFSYFAHSQYRYARTTHDKPGRQGLKGEALPGAGLRHTAVMSHLSAEIREGHQISPGWTGRRETKV
jgi:hypothetical protein